MLFSDYLKRMDNLGVYLPQPVFSDGQLYVELDYHIVPDSRLINNTNASYIVTFISTLK